MRLLRINGTDVDIDESTAIGLTLQSYDIKNPAQPKVSRTNSFSIPKTNSNLQIFGHIQNPQSLTNIPYTKMLCDYWESGEQILSNARVQLESITDRINIYVFEKPNIWDELKKYEHADMVANYLEWLQDEQSYASPTSPTSDALINSGIITNTEHLFLPFYKGNLELDFLTDNTIILGNTISNGGHICAYIKSLFQFFEYKFDVDFGATGTSFDYNIFNDDVAKKMYVPLRDIAINDANTYFYISTAPFTPFEELQDKEGLTAFSLVSNFFKHFNIIVDKLIVSGADVIGLRRYDDIEKNTNIIDFTAKLSNVKSFRNTIPDFGQKNTIKFSSVSDESAELANSKVLSCLNDNLKVDYDLLTIDAFVNSIVEIESKAVANLATEKAFKNYSFLVSGTNTISSKVNIKPKPTSESIINEKLTNVDLTTFFSENSGKRNTGTSAGINTYAKSFSFDVVADNFIELDWSTVSGATSFQVTIYSVTNSVIRASALLTSGTVSYNCAFDETIEIRIVSNSASGTSFEINDFAGQLYEYEEDSTTLTLKVAELYSLSGEYDFFQTIIEKPRVYECDFWLTIRDFRNLEFFKQYYVQQLNGSYFINKIGGYNPNSKQPTTIELIKVSDKIPAGGAVEKAWVDGIGDKWVDGVANTWVYG